MFLNGNVLRLLVLDEKLFTFFSNFLDVDELLQNKRYFTDFIKGFLKLTNHIPEEKNVFSIFEFLEGKLFTDQINFWEENKYLAFFLTFHSNKFDIFDEQEGIGDEDVQPFLHFMGWFFYVFPNVIQNHEWQFESNLRQLETCIFEQLDNVKFEYFQFQSLKDEIVWCLIDVATDLINYLQVDN